LLIRSKQTFRCCHNERQFHVQRAYAPLPNWLHDSSQVSAREYNEERPKKVLGGLTPAAYAKRMAEIGYPNPGL